VVSPPRGARAGVGFVIPREPVRSSYSTLYYGAECTRRRLLVPVKPPGDRANDCSSRLLARACVPRLGHFDIGYDTLFLTRAALPFARLTLPPLGDGLLLVTAPPSRAGRTLQVAPARLHCVNVAPHSVKLTLHCVTVTLHPARSRPHRVRSSLHSVMHSPYPSSRVL
jgi:hypothetical protein